MTLLISTIAALVSTICWYFNPNRKELKLGLLCWMFWGASIMWLVDAVNEYMELGAAYFTPGLEDLINDSFLGLTIVIIAMIIWIVLLLIKDPKGVVREALFSK